MDSCRLNHLPMSFYRELLRDYFTVMLMYRDSTLYLLHDHHKYLDWRRDAVRVVLETNVAPPPFDSPIKPFYYVHSL